MAIQLTPNIKDTLTAARWRSLKLYNGYRLVIAILFFVTQSAIGDKAYWQDNYVSLVLAYFIFSCISGLLTWLEKPSINYNLPTQIIIEIVFILLLMHMQQDGVSNIGLLLIITIASASLISDGRYALFYASLATIGILLEQSYQLVSASKPMQNYTSAVILSLSCFATAWLAYSLAKRVQQSEWLAVQRGLDVKNMAQINALISHEMQDGVLVVDQSLQIKHHNIQAKRLLNLDFEDNEPSNWQGKSLQTLSPEISQMIRRWMYEDNVLNESSHANILKLSTLSRELRLRLLPVAENRHEGAVIFIEDWSQMQTQAHQVKLAALGRLTANIAHEIRNPLSAISHANQLLQEEEDNNPATTRMLQIIADNVQRLDQIIKDVLELNRRDRTNQELIQLENFMTDFYTQFCAVEKIPAHCFKLTLQNSNTMIAFDRRHLNQILWNLCKNGWRHSKNVENSLKLTVLTSTKRQDVQIEITDDGKGIPESVRSHLFEPFFTTEKSGTGLGLYIARELADANGAVLQLKTPAKAANVRLGTQFIMYIKKA
ncbi:BaeS Signal transduction histidine kinase [Methylophilaceae bacterium]